MTKAEADKIIADATESFRREQQYTFSYGECDACGEPVIRYGCRAELEAIGKLKLCAKHANLSSWGEWKEPN